MDNKFIKRCFGDYVVDMGFKCHLINLLPVSFVSMFVYMNHENHMQFILYLISITKISSQCLLHKVDTVPTLPQANKSRPSQLNYNKLKVTFIIYLVGIKILSFNYCPHSYIKICLGSEMFGNFQFHETGRGIDYLSFSELHLDRTRNQ